MNRLPRMSIRWQKISVLLLTIIFFLVVLELFLWLGGLLFVSFHGYANKSSLAQKGTYRILCLGESTTANQYPPFLDKILNRSNIGIKFSVIDKGVVATNSSAILRQLEGYLATYRPDMVIAMMGSNDRNVMYYQEIPEASGKLFRYYRTYRLLRLSFLRLAKKIYNPQANKDKMQVFVSPIECSPGNAACYSRLGEMYAEQGRFAEAEEALKKCIELDYQNTAAYERLGWVYEEENKDPQTEELFTKAIGQGMERDRFYGTLAVYYQGRGDEERAKKYYRKAAELRMREYNPTLVSNYHRLREILDVHKIKLVCMSYPMQSTAPLKKIFADNPDGIIFVNNERIFKDAVWEKSYKAYFLDMFGGDFGHCTDKGNRLLAENIAGTILREAFGK